MLNYKLSKYDSKYEKLADYYFQAALDAFGVDKTNTHKSLKKVPNKSSLLMCYKYLTLHKLAFSKLNKSSLLEIQDINNQACFVWKEIIKSNSSKNKSQNLAIYNLNPYDETISILLEKEKIGEKLDKNLLFEATQYLKNFDVVLSREQSNDFNYSLVDFQKSL